MIFFIGVARIFHAGMHSLFPQKLVAFFGRRLQQTIQTNLQN